MSILILFALILILLYFLPKYRKPLVFSNFLSQDECDYIRKRASSKMQPSTISEDKNIDVSVRKSDTAWLSLNDPVVRRVAERCIAMTDRPLVNCEKLQVLRYKEGGFYRPHQDVITGHPNKRMYTFILALNDGYEGGSTAFPNIHRMYKLKKGDVLFFDTLDNYEMATSKALHSGTKVLSGEKWIANLWVHKYDFTTGN